MESMMRMEDCLNSDGPDFIGLGGRRCGSSNLHQILNEHPQVSKPIAGTHFFSDKFSHADYAQYAAMFPQSAMPKRRIDLSVSYLYPEYASVVAQRIKHYRSEAKLFVQLRNPIDRAYSDYLRSIKMLELDPKMGFADACREHPEFVERSKYHALLKPYWQAFGVTNVKLFMFEEMILDKEAFFRDMSAFFGIAVDPFLSATQEKMGHAHKVKSAELQRLILGTKSGLRRGAKTIGLAKPWDFVTRRLQPVYQRILAMNALDDPMVAKDRAFVKDLLQEDMDQLEAVIGKEQMTHWRNDLRSTTDNEVKNVGQ